MHIQIKCFICSVHRSSDKKLLLRKSLNNNDWIVDFTKVIFPDDCSKFSKCVWILPRLYTAFYFCKQTRHHRALLWEVNSSNGDCDWKHFVKIKTIDMLSSASKFGISKVDVFSDRGFTKVEPSDFSNSWFTKGISISKCCEEWISFRKLTSLYFSLKISTFRLKFSTVMFGQLT